MTAAALEAALRDLAARLARVSSAAKARALVPELTGLAGSVAGAIPPIQERRTPNSDRRLADGPLPVGRTRMRMGLRRGRGARILPPTPPVVVVPPGSTASQLSNVTDPSGAVDGVAFTTQPRVRLLDANGNIVSNPSTTVTAAINTGTGSLAGTLTSVTDSNGIAIFTNLKIAGSGNHTLAYTASGLTGATSGTFSVATSSKLAMVTQPANASSGSAFLTQPAVRLQTSGSANVARSGVSVTAAIASGTGSLSGTTSVNTDANGVATFTNLVITGTGAHTLQFTSSGLTSVTSGSFTVSASGGSPALTFEPDQYASSAALRAATGAWGASSGSYTLTNAAPFVAVEDISVNSTTVTLGTDGGYGGRSKYMRYNFSGGTDVEVTVGRAMALNHVDSSNDWWVEWSFRISSNFETSFAANSSYGVPAYKFVFLMFPGTGRFQQTFVWNATTMEIGDANIEDRGSIGIPAVTDGQWHLARWHAKVNPSSGVNIIYIDGVEQYNFAGNTGPSDKGEWYAFAMGRNSNRGFGTDTTVDWGHVKLYTSNPGWGF